MNSVSSTKEDFSEPIVAQVSDFAYSKPRGGGWRPRKETLGGEREGEKTN